MSDKEQSYWVLRAGGNPNAMLLYSLPEPGEWAGWIDGTRFPSPPKQPIVARIQPGSEQADPPVFKQVPQIMTVAFMDALQAAGVDNIDYYDVDVVSKDGKIKLAGYKAYNIVGVVSAADMSQTEFSDTNPSRQIDASIRTLAVGKNEARGLLLFRLFESVDTILIHDSVKRSLEKHAFKGVKFVPPKLHIS